MCFDRKIRKKNNVYSFPIWRPSSSWLEIVTVNSEIFTRVLCRRAEMFYLSQLGIEPRSLDLQANTLPCRCKGRLSRSVFIHTYTP